MIKPIEVRPVELSSKRANPTLREAELRQCDRSKLREALLLLQLAPTGVFG